jgi:hypothetical protein
MRTPLSVLILTLLLPSNGELLATCYNTPITLPQVPGYAVKYITDFGAVPNDGCNDQYAFEAAAAWFNLHHGNGELDFKPGEYIVGRQIPGGGGMYMQGVSPLDFHNCAHLDLAGIAGQHVVIRYDDCLLYGGFDPVTGDRLLYGCGEACTLASEIADLGACINLKDCENITIKNLELDGNQDVLIVGGYTSYDCNQEEHTGVFMSNCYSVLMHDDSIHDFALDGWTLLASSSFPHGLGMHITAYNCQFNRNGRNGFSWTGGTDVSCYDCSFDLNSTGEVESPPGAGLDIEYTDLLGGFSSAPLHNGLFQHCTFRYNRGWGAISDCTDDALLPVESGFDFEQCTIVGSYAGEALHPNARAMTFTDCDIHGVTEPVFDCSRTCHLPDRTSFTNCRFDETYMNPFTNVLESIGVGTPFPVLLNTMVGPGLGGFHLEKCTFHTVCKLMPFLLTAMLYGTCPPPDNMHATVLDCIYIYDDGGGVPYSMGPAYLWFCEINNFTLRFPDTPCGAGDPFDPSNPCALFWDYACVHPGTPTPIHCTDFLFSAEPPANFANYCNCPSTYMDPYANVLPGCWHCPQYPECIPCRTTEPPIDCRILQHHEGRMLTTHPSAAVTSELTVFPDPATDRITLSMVGEMSVGNIAVIYDPSGREVLRSALSGNGELDVQRLDAGTYVLVVVNSSTKAVAQTMFVKQ